MKKLILSALTIATVVMTGCENPLSQETEAPSLTSNNKKTIAGATARDLPRAIVARISSTNDVYFNWEAGWDTSSAGKARAVEGGYYSAQTEYDFVPAYGVCLAGNAYKTSNWGSTWNALGGSNDFVDIATGGGNTFAVSSNGQAYKLDKDTDSFSLLGGIPNETVTRIDVDPGGNPWVVTASGDVYSFHMDSTTLSLEFDHNKERANATDVGCGDGRIIVAATAHTIESKNLYIYGPVSGFEKMQGTTGAIRVDVDKKNRIWAIREDNTLWRDTTINTKAQFIRDVEAGSDNIDIGA